MILLEQKKISNTLGIIHIIGIGGIGMSGIAEIMHNLGYKVQGSDITSNYNTQRLSSLGIKIFSCHEAMNVNGVSYVVVSTAINKDNAEIQAAMENKIPVIKRSEMLAELMRLKCSIAVSGSHGKTTTTSLIACLFEAAGLLPTVINGGIINNKSTNAYLGSGDYLIAEADESDATFIRIPSTIAVITNIDPEHMDYYKDFKSLVSAFKNFVENLPFYGFAVACIDHSVVRDLVSNITERKIITYGINSKDAHVQAFNIHSNISSSTFDVKIDLPNVRGSTIIEQVVIPTPGVHNILNALAAISIAVELDFGIKVIKDGFQCFQGVKRRFTKTGEYNGASIIDDYAHHPAEVIATLATARSIADKQNGRVIAAFQPHRYSRLKYLFDDFVKCFVHADLLYITDVYSAGEEVIAGASGEALVNEINSTNTLPKAVYVSGNDEIRNTVRSIARPGDLIVMMGAGSISTWANSLSAELNSSTNS